MQKAKASGKSSQATKRGSTNTIHLRNSNREGARLPYVPSNFIAINSCYYKPAIDKNILKRTHVSNASQTLLHPTQNTSPNFVKIVGFNSDFIAKSSSYCFKKMHSNSLKDNGYIYKALQSSAKKERIPRVLTGFNGF